MLNRLPRVGTNTLLVLPGSKHRSTQPHTHPNKTHQAWSAAAKRARGHGECSPQVHPIDEEVHALVVALAVPRVPHNGVVVVLPIRHEVHGLAVPRGSLHTLQPSAVSKVPDQGKMGCIVGCDCMARRNTVDTFNAHAPCCCTQVPSLTFECKCSCSSWRCCTGRCTCTRQARPQRVHRTHPGHPLDHGSTRTRNRRRTMTSQKSKHGHGWHVSRG